MGGTFKSITKSKLAASLEISRKTLLQCLIHPKMLEKLELTEQEVKDKRIFMPKHHEIIFNHIQ